ncbi:hypothetical protein HFN_0329 [Helicobacter fennelliae MRY12-0050]|uniref:Uncharacterized protein n=1 Tax=Helicobacter fennelliae MRY12-0050 TaxID=1325130 RepID=T1DW03_9HELI|nr:hypothetical protein HFN_0329 [Helicobacter fennelliae MRY12-0050]
MCFFQSISFKCLITDFGFCNEIVSKITAKVLRWVLLQDFLINPLCHSFVILRLAIESRK